MGYKYTINIHDEDGEMLVEHELTSDQAILIVARALADSKRQQMTDAPAEDRPTPPKTAKKEKGAVAAPSTNSRKCGKCGVVGHIARKCPDGGAEAGQESQDPAPSEKADRIKELLRKGLADGEIASMTGSTTQVVKFYRKQMVQRGEIEN